MMKGNTLRHLSSFFGTIIPMRSLIRMTGFRLVMPFYHTVSDQELPHVASLYRIRNSREFEREIDSMLKIFSPVSALQVYEMIASGRTFDKPSVLISLDDGFREVAEIVAPMLKRKGVPGLFFISPAFIDNKDMFFRCKCSLLIDRLKNISSPQGIFELISSRLPYKINTRMDLTRYLMSLDYGQTDTINELAGLFDMDFSSYLKVRQPYMTSRQIKDLLADGFELGAHSIDHPEYSLLSNGQQLKQTMDSMDYMCRTFDIATRYFAFPFTDSGVNDQFFEQMFSKEEGYPHLMFGTAGLKKDIYPRHLQRLPVEDSTLGAKAYARSEYIMYMGKRILGRHYVNRESYDR